MNWFQAVTVVAVVVLGGWSAGSGIARMVSGTVDRTGVGSLVGGVGAIGLGVLYARSPGGWLQLVLLLALAVVVLAGSLIESGRRPNAVARNSHG